MMRVSPVQQYSDKYFVISHLDITKRKLAEEEANSLAKMDGLTGIPNRRTFDDFINNEIKRCARLKNPICLAIIDIDHFKLLNDTYGHLAGDKCLVAVSKLLEQYANRPRDIFARYGGEEFALVWGDTPLADAKMLAKKLLQDIANLNIPNPNSPITNHLTASIGIVEVWPDQNTTEDALIDKADHLLYKAKENGRNRLEC